MKLHFLFNYKLLCFYKYLMMSYSPAKYFTSFLVFPLMTFEKLQMSYSNLLIFPEQIFSCSKFDSYPNAEMFYFLISNLSPRYVPITHRHMKMFSETYVFISWNIRTVHHLGRLLWEFGININCPKNFHQTS